VVEHEVVAHRAAGSEAVLSKIAVYRTTILEMAAYRKIVLKVAICEVWMAVSSGSCLGTA